MLIVNIEEPFEVASADEIKLRGKARADHSAAGKREASIEIRV